MVERVEFDPIAIRVEMARRDWKRLDLARAAGISNGTLRRALKGDCSLLTAYKIGLALALNAPLDSLDGLISRSKAS